MRRGQCSNPIVKALNRLQGNPQLIDKHQCLQSVGRNDGFIQGERCGVLDGSQSCFQHMSKTHVMRMEESLKSAPAGPLHLQECWPTRNEVTENRRIDVIERKRNINHNLSV